MNIELQNKNNGNIEIKTDTAFGTYDIYKKETEQNTPIKVSSFETNLSFEDITHKFDARITKIVSFNGITFMCAGSGSGKLFISTDDTSWQEIDLGFGTVSVTDLYYHDGTYIAVGGQGKLSVSNDGYSWGIIDSGFDNNYIYSVTNINNEWIIVGGGGRVGTSSDGTVWETNTTTITSSIRKVVYGNGIYVLITSHNKVFTSTDLITYNEVTNNISPSLIGISDIYFNGIQFIICGSAIVGIYRRGAIAKSKDTIVWEVNRDDFTDVEILTSIGIYNNHIIVGSGADSEGLGGFLYISYNNNVWDKVQHIGGTKSSVGAIHYNGRILYVQSGWFTTQTVMSSINTITTIEDYINKNNISYTYELVNSQTNTFIIEDIVSCYNNSFICDKDSSFSIICDKEYVNYEMNNISMPFETFGNKYPIVTRNSINEYTSGFFKFHINKTGYDVDRKEEVKYRKKVIEFMTNKKPKIIKDINGNLWVVAIINSTAVALLKDMGNAVGDIEFEWVEIADYMAEEQLKKIGMLELQTQQGG